MFTETISLLRTRKGGSREEMNSSSARSDPQKQNGSSTPVRTAMLRRYSTAVVHCIYLFKTFFFFLRGSHCSLSEIGFLKVEPNIGIAYSGVLRKRLRTKQVSLIFSQVRSNLCKVTCALRSLLFGQMCEQRQCPRSNS